MPIDFNGTNFTNDWSSIPFLPYIGIFGDLFFAILLLVVGAGIYLGTDRNTFTTAIYFFVVAVVFGAILNMFISSFILLITGLVFSFITYNAVMEKKPR
jgi:hypothetical protein